MGDLIVVWEPLAIGWGSQKSMPRYPGMVQRGNEQRGRKRKGEVSGDAIMLLPSNSPWGPCSSSFDFCGVSVCVRHTQREKGALVCLRMYVCMFVCTWVCMYVPV